MKHTPGPWDVYIHDEWSNYYGNISHNWQENGMNYTRTIATILKYASEEERQANASLIAAAPELLEALQSCIKCLTMDSDMEEDFSPEITLAKNAIKKATGE